MSHLEGKVVVVTGAASGFGRLVSEMSAARGAQIVCADINEPALESTVSSITDNNGSAVAQPADVTRIESMQALVQRAVDTYGGVDVFINNAGIMPLAFYADHADAASAWDRCIDINIKGVLNGIMAVYDQMISQGRGHVVNLSSIYSNFPVAGAGVYGASKAAVNVLSESLRVESQGRIKVTVVRPTGVPGTNLGAGVVNQEAIVGILGQNAADYGEKMFAIAEGSPANPKWVDDENIEYAALAPEHLAAQIVHAIDQPWGVTIGDITVRAAGEGYIL